MNNLISELGLDFLFDVKMPKSIGLLFKPNQELTKKDYFTRYLNPSDAMHLQLFLGYFASRIEEEVVILAVGNSTFSKKYWKRIEKMRQKDPQSEILPKSYRDIDLLVLSKQEIKRDILEERVKKALNDWELRYDTFKKTYSKKDFFERNDGTYACLVDYNLGNRMISTNLPNKRELDLILGTEETLKPAKEKIKEERKSKKPFCIVYGKS